MTSPFDGLRFAFGTLTVLPVRVTRWDRETARGGMLSAPVAGLVVGGCAAGLGLLLLYLGASPLLAAVASAAVPAALTRGLHLDGLADTADGLGSGRPAEDALRIMKQSDIGPFGVLTLILVLLAQVAALTQLYDASWARGALAAVVSAVAARLALTLAARDGVPPRGRRGSGRRWPVWSRCGARYSPPYSSRWRRRSRAGGSDRTTVASAPSSGRSIRGPFWSRTTPSVPHWPSSAPWSPPKSSCGTARAVSAGSPGTCSAGWRRRRRPSRSCCCAWAASAG